ncbi:MAG: copper amine oxidase domain protein [Bacilli bacterium]|nr:copper amine oxidase domain protein [Bacilli bacterium]
MGKRGWKKFISLGLVALLVILVGCQAIGSLDLNKALIDSMTAKSEMSRGSLALDIKLDDSNTSNPEQTAMLKLLGSIKLNLDQVNQESTEKFSVIGSIDIAHKKIPFHATLSTTQLVLQIEGAKKPILLDLTGMTNSALALPLSLGLDQDLIEQMTKKLESESITKAILGFFVNGLPNPEGIQVDEVTEAVYGVSMPLHHVQAQVDGSQLLPLFKKFILNLLQDDKGLRDLVTQLYDVLQPVLISMFDKMDAEDHAKEMPAPMPNVHEQSGKSDEPQMDPGTMDMPNAENMPAAPSMMPSIGSGLMFSSILKSVESMMKDRPMAIEFLHTEVKQLLVVLMVAVDSLENQKDSPVSQVFNDKSYVKANLYVDNDGKLRKSKIEVKLAPPKKDNGGIAEINLTMESEHWNINQPVQADVIDTTDSLSVSMMTRPAEMLNLLDKNSVLYDLLKNDLKITRKTFNLNMNDAAYQPFSFKPYIDQGVTMVPARYITQQFEADLTWNDAAQQITISDAASGAVIVLTLDSKIAEVNGKKVELDKMVRNRDGVTYVPLKFIADSLGAAIHWNEADNTITITRD